jgi:hypothetical protein
MVTSFGQLDDDNFAWYAMNNYDNPQCCELSEFHDDLHRFKYIKRLLGRYIQSEDLQERLILNHIVVIFNVFGIEASLRMLKFKFKNKHQWSIIKPFLIYLNYLPDNELIDIPLDPQVVDVLRKL